MAVLYHVPFKPLANQGLQTVRSEPPIIVDDNVISRHAPTFRRTGLDCRSASSVSVPGKEPTMVIGDRLRTLREHKKFSQGEIEKRTGLLRCYLSRVEDGHTVPAIHTLEKLAKALEVPIYQLFY
jgi:DNA-binding XRE family transcriptional regulator